MRSIPKWMVCHVFFFFQMDDLGVPYILGTNARMILHKSFMVPWSWFQPSQPMTPAELGDLQGKGTEGWQQPSFATISFATRGT